MPDLYTLLREFEENGGYQQIAGNPRAQFGRGPRRYVGTTLLPEMTVPSNAFREDGVRYRTVIANSGSRYSPAQLKEGDLVGSVLVELGESDIGREFTSRKYDALLGMLARNLTMEAVVEVTSWLDTAVNLALVELLEKQRWDAIVSAQVTREGDNEYSEVVSYPNPTGHRVAQSAAWSTDSTDIFEDIFALADVLTGKGYTVNRMITSRTVLSIMAGNDTVKTRTGIAVVNASGQITSAAGRATLDAINGILGSDGLPPIELYDLQYRTQNGTGYFLPRDVFVMVATTGRDEEIDLGDEMELLTDTLGYTAIGRAAGQSTPGRVIRAEAKADKPPRIEAEGWQTALPVITEPEAIGVINSIS